MNKPKYQISDHIPNSEFVVRGIAPQKNGDYLYWIQIIGSDNTFVTTYDGIVRVLNDIAKNLKELQNIILRSSDIDY
jgi:hypothetical protein